MLFTVKARMRIKKGVIPIGKVSQQVKRRYEKKVYKQYLIRLRKVEDEPLIAAIEEEKEAGGSPKTFLQKLFYRNE